MNYVNKKKIRAMSKSEIQASKSLIYMGKENFLTMSMGRFT